MLNKKTVYHLALSTLIFLFIDRIIRFVGTYQTNKYEIEHRRISIELALVSILSIFIFITLRIKGVNPFMF